MNYKDTLHWMFEKLPMYQRQGPTAFKKDLTNSIALSKQLGFPENKFLSIHVAGTNGKGSTSHMIASVLQEAGYKTGLYTSPHLKDFRERIKINGIPIPKKSVVDFITDHKSFLETHKLSFFEMTVGLAFDTFARNKIDIAIVEVGLGGRLDSTNIITPLVSVITNIGLDHTQFLGHTLKEIAFEKAGIIKDGVPIVIGEHQGEIQDVFKDIAVKHATPLSFADTSIKQAYPTDLLGNYQKKNVKTAMQVLHIIRDKNVDISEDKIKKGLLNVVKNTNLKGRWQILKTQPKVICDTAHNKEGLSLVLRQLDSEKYKRLHIVLGFVNDKNLDLVLPLFPKKASYYFCKPDVPRGLLAVSLQNKAVQFDLKGEVYFSVNEAYQAALSYADKKDLIYIGGSTFVVAELPI